MVEKYFIDGGGNKSQSTRMAMEKFPGYKIHVFECNPGFEKYYKDLPITFHKEAIWVDDGEIDFYPASYSESSTLVKGKVSGSVNYDKPIKVPCIDFSKWLDDTFNFDDEIILKLNIEGAEVEVLEKMIQDKTIFLIDKLFVNFHAIKIKTISFREEALKDDLRRIGYFPEKWFVPHGHNYYPHGNR